MSTSLKDINKPALVLIVVVNVIGYYAFLNSLSLESFGNLISEYEQYIPALLLASVVGVLNSLLDHTTKARIIFWRWNNPLPACRAFTEIMLKDDRIDPAALQAFTNPLPTDPSEQNRLWFKWYREVQDEPGVKQVHREYLFTRDWACLTLLLSIVFIPLAFYQMTLADAGIVTVVLLLEYLLVRKSAINHAHRFVASVLAYKGASR